MDRRSSYSLSYRRRMYRRRKLRRARRRACLLIVTALSAAIFAAMGVMAMARPEGRGIIETGEGVVPAPKEGAGAADGPEEQTETMPGAEVHRGQNGGMADLPAPVKGVQVIAAAVGELNRQGKDSLWEKAGIRTRPFCVAVDGEDGEDEIIAEKLRVRLEALGYEVLTAGREGFDGGQGEETGENHSPQEDVYISIRQNPGGGLGNGPGEDPVEGPGEDPAEGPAESPAEGPDSNGIGTWYYGDEGSGDSRRLAQLVLWETASAAGGTKGADPGELLNDVPYIPCTDLRQASIPFCVISTGLPPGSGKDRGAGGYGGTGKAQEQGQEKNPQQNREQDQEQLGDQLADGIARGIDLFFHPKTMYLTFDDGPSKENTSAVLDILKARNIKAAFFVVGENVRKHPEVAQRIVAEGHTIGIHCNHHDYAEIYQSVDSYVEDFEQAYRAVLEVTGVEAKLYRFPGGSVNAYNKAVCEDIIEEMDSRGFIYFDWNASLEDTVKKADSGDLAANARKTAMGRKRVVLLAHDMVRGTALCLDELIDQMPEYRMEPLTPDVEPVQFGRMK